MKELKGFLEWSKRQFERFMSWSFKEEAIAVILFIAGFVFMNHLFKKMYPESGGFFDLASQFETLIYVVMKFGLMIVMAWVGLAIIFPEIYQFIRKVVYSKFNEFTLEIKLDWSLKLIITLLICAAVAFSGRAGTREDLKKLVYSQVGIHEVTENSSPEIDQYLSHVHVYHPAPWCVSWVSYDLSKVGVNNPMSAWSPDYAQEKDIIWTPKNPKTKPLTGDVITIYFASLKRVGHGGFYLSEDKSGYFITGEGNANQKLSRTGGEVCILKRDPQKIHAITRYIK